MNEMKTDPQQSDESDRLQKQGSQGSRRSDRRESAQSKRENRKHTALIVALIVVVIAIMVGLSWALVSGQWSDEKNAKSAASSSSSSSSLSSPRADAQDNRKTGKSGKSDASDQSDQADQTGQSDKANDSDGSSKTDSQDNHDTQSTPLPKVNKRAAERFAATYKECGAGKPFNETNTSQESLILEKGNRTLTLLSGDKSDFSLYKCVVKQLGIPADQAQKMEAKKVSQSLQVFDFDGLTAQWSYSPSGLDLYVTQKQ
jgi:cytoskeletal protein RodZ